MKRFWVLLVKEIRELITPQTIVPIIAIVLVFLAMSKLIAQQVKVSSQPQPVMVVDQDNSVASAAVIQVLKQSNLAVTQAPQKPDFGGRVTQKAVLVIPDGFGKALSKSEAATIESYTVQDGFSAARLADTALVTAALAKVNEALAAERLAQVAPHSKVGDLLAPVRNDEHLVVGGKVAAISPAKVGAYLSSQIALVPVVLFVVIMFAGQMVASAMANEKENKTLETLLSVPISRTSIVGAKMLAAGIVSSLTAAAYVYGLHGVQSSFSGSQGLDDATKAAINQLGLNFSLSSYLLLGLVLFLGILAALAIALVLGAFAENIKSVQSLIMPLVVLLIIPYIATMVTDPATLPRAFQIVLYAIPFTYTFQAMPNLYVHNYGLVLIGALYELVFFGVFIVVAAKLFASDKLLTLRVPGLRLRR
jgi:ABC-2 type transport system permease protein